MDILCPEKIGQAAQKSLQAAFTTFTKSFQNEWRLFQRITEGFNEEYKNLKTAIHQNFTPNIFAQEMSDSQHELFALPTRYGGLNIQNPIKRSENYFENSGRCLDKLITAITNGKPLDLNDHIATLHQTTVQPCKRVFKLMTIR